MWVFSIFDQALAAGGPGPAKWFWAQPIANLYTTAFLPVEDPNQSVTIILICSST